MPEIGSSGLMSGDGKRGVGHRPQATVPVLDSTTAELDDNLSAYCCGFGPPTPAFAFHSELLSIRWRCIV